MDSCPLACVWQICQSIASRATTVLVCLSTLSVHFQSIFCANSHSFSPHWSVSKIRLVVSYSLCSHRELIELNNFHWLINLQASILLQLLQLYPFPLSSTFFLTSSSTSSLLAFSHLCIVARQNAIDVIAGALVADTACQHSLRVLQNVISAAECVNLNSF